MKGRDQDKQKEATCRKQTLPIENLENEQSSPQRDKRKYETTGQSIKGIFSKFK